MATYTRPRSTRYNVIQYAGSLDSVGGMDVTVQQCDDNGAILAAFGDTLPVDGTAQYAPGCIFRLTSTSSGYSNLYTNFGTDTSCLFQPTTTAKSFTATVGFTNADYICDGVADNVQIQAALTAVSDAGGGTVFLKNGTYNTIAAISLPANVEVLGESRKATIVKLGANRNVSVFINADSTSGTPFIALRNFTIDQNGANQTSAGGGFSGAYITDLLMEDMIFETSYNFNFFFSANAGTAMQGTSTFTLNSQTLAGSGTNYLTALSPGTIIKSAGGEFVRILEITSDTSAKLEVPWGFATETNVVAKIVPPNVRNRVINCVFNGSLNTDNVGLGIFVDSFFKGNVSRNSGGGYGFGPDHCYDTQFIGNVVEGNNNSGFGVETCYACIFSGNTAKQNGVDGIALVSGSRNNVVSNNICSENSRGIHLTFNSASFPRPDWNSIIGNICANNLSHGIRLGGAIRNVVEGNICRNNGQGGTTAGGITLASDTATAPQRNIITGNSCYDTQTTKTQAYGIWIAAGTNNDIANNYSPNVDNLTSGILDSGSLNLKRNNFGVNPDIIFEQGNITGATTFTRVNGDVITATITGNVTTAITNGTSPGDTLTLQITQSGGGNTISKPANVKLVGGAFSPSAGAGAVDVWTLVWDGISWNETSRSLNIS